jgi:adenylate kinase
VPRISTGDMLRSAIALGYALGRELKSTLTEGNLAPDNIVIGLVEDRLGNTDCGAGAVFDGFPRTLPQAEALDDGSQGVARRSTILLN